MKAAFFHGNVPLRAVLPGGVDGERADRGGWPHHLRHAVVVALQKGIKRGWSVVHVVIAEHEPPDDWEEKG